MSEAELTLNYALEKQQKRELGVPSLRADRSLPLNNDDILRLQTISLLNGFVICSYSRLRTDTSSSTVIILLPSF